jgi:hypothetical protein
MECASMWRSGGKHPYLLHEVTSHYRYKTLPG